MQVLREVVDAMTPAEQELLRRGLFVGQAISEYRESFGRGDFLVRNVIGVDEATGAIEVADYVRPGRTVQFHVRDAETADEDLTVLLDAQRTRDVPAAGGAAVQLQRPGHAPVRRPVPRRRRRPQGDAGHAGGRILRGGGVRARRRAELRPRAHGELRAVPAEVSASAPHAANTPRRESRTQCGFPKTSSRSQTPFVVPRRLANEGAGSSDASSLRDSSSASLLGMTLLRAAWRGTPARIRTPRGLATVRPLCPGVWAFDAAR